MDQLPSEVLKIIFSFLAPYELFAAERVCVAWKREIESVWKRKRTISRKDVNPYAKHVVQMDNLASLLRRLANVEYYPFPLVDAFNDDATGFVCPTATCAVSVQLRDLVRDRVEAGRLPAHLAEIEDYHAVERCHSLIVDEWKAAGEDQDVLDKLQRVLPRMPCLKTVVVRLLDISYGHERLAGQVRRVLSALSQTVEDIRVVEVECNDADEETFVSLRLDARPFTCDEFAHLLATVQHEMGKKASECFSVLLDGWERDGRVRSVSLGTRHFPVRVEQLRDALEHADAAPRSRAVELYRRLLRFNVTSLHVADVWSHEKLQFGLLPRHVLDHLSDLRISVERIAAEPRYCRFDPPPEVVDEDLVVLWESILDAAASARRLESFTVSVDMPGWNQCSRLLPSPPTTHVLLPHLQSITIKAVISASHFSTLLLAATNLRHLQLETRSEQGDEKKEHRSFARAFLDAIGAKTSLTSLKIRMNAATQDDVFWLEPWLSVPSRGAQWPGHVPRIHVCLRREVLRALSKLVQLETLDLNFFPLQHYFPNHKLESTELRRDKERLQLALPRLAQVKLCRRRPF